MRAYFACTMTIAVAFATSVAAAADEQDCDTPSMSDETSLLVSKLHIDRTEKKDYILQASEAQATFTSWLLDPEAQQQAQTKSMWGNGIRILCQLFFGIVYYLIFVNGREIQKTLYDDPSAEARANFAKGPLAGCLEGGLANCVFAWFCTGPHAGRTFHMTNTCNYWGGCICMAFCPCITLLFVHSCTDLEERLGGEAGHKENICLSGLCAFCCSCCVVAHDSGNLDKVYGQTTGFCGAEP